MRPIQKIREARERNRLRIMERWFAMVDPVTEAFERYYRCWEYERLRRERERLGKAP